MDILGFGRCCGGGVWGDRSIPSMGQGVIMRCWLAVAVLCLVGCGDVPQPPGDAKPRDLSKTVYELANELERLYSE